MRSSISLALLLVASTFLPIAASTVYPTVDDTTPARIVSMPAVAVPEEAQKTGLGGKVSVVVKIGKDGLPASVLSTSGPDWVCDSVTRADVLALRTAAAQAAKLSKFVPASKKGKPRESYIRLAFNFPGKDRGSEPVTGGVADTDAPPSIEEPDEARKSDATIVNGRAISLPRPIYPAAALAARASGKVEIGVVVGEDGRVFSAEPKVGHPLLRQASREAACKARFTQTLVDGKPVEVAGIIGYGFR